MVPKALGVASVTLRAEIGTPLLELDCNFVVSAQL